MNSAILPLGLYLWFCHARIAFQWFFCSCIVRMYLIWTSLFQRSVLHCFPSSLGPLSTSLHCAARVVQFLFSSSHPAVCQLRCFKLSHEELWTALARIRCCDSKFIAPFLCWNESLEVFHFEPTVVWVRRRIFSSSTLKQVKYWPVALIGRFFAQVWALVPYCIWFVSQAVIVKSQGPS